MQALAERLREQQGRHQGGSKWIGTAGTSPFGAFGYNPEGVRIGQDEGRHGRAVKVWDRREFRNLDDDGRARHPQHQGGAAPAAPLGARGRARTSSTSARTIRRTAEQGWLDVVTRPERHNAVKVLLFLDVGGSMDPHVRRGRGAVLGGAGRVQAPRALLLPQLPLRGRLARQPPALGRADPDRGGAAHLRPRLPGDLRRRRGDVALRDHPARRRQRALERRERRDLAAPPARHLAARDLDQPDARRRPGATPQSVGDDRARSSAGGCIR